MWLNDNLQKSSNEPTCQYESAEEFGELRLRLQCQEPIYSNGKCLLHADFPDDKQSPEYVELINKKGEKIAERVAQNRCNFVGVKLASVDLDSIAQGCDKNKVKTELHFEDAVITGDVVLKHELHQNVRFDKATLRHVLFDGARIYENVRFVDAKINGCVRFQGAEVDKSVVFGGVRIDGDVLFRGAKIGKHVWFDGAKIGDVWFEGIRVGRDAHFDGAQVCNSARFDLAEITGSVFFEHSEIKNALRFDNSCVGANLEFGGARIGKDASFRNMMIKNDAFFDKAIVGGKLLLQGLEIGGELSFKNAVFQLPAAQEEACRRAKQTFDRLGDRREADGYHYREMEAKRMQKSPWARYLELPMQYVFGYGVHPERLFTAFLIALIGFGVFYWAEGTYSSSFLSSLRFSFTTMMIPGSGLLIPLSGFVSAAVIIQALFGLLVWGTFIATLSRMFGR